MKTAFIKIVEKNCRKKLGNPLLSKILYLYFYSITPESPRWLIAKGKYKQAKDIITDMAEVNCKEIPVKLELEPQPEILEVPLHGDINTITNKVRI